MVKETLPLGRVKPKDLDAAGVVRLPRTIAAKDGAPVLEDGRVIDVANVVWCTGYRPAFDWVHLDAFDEEGQPFHTRGVAAEPGMYFIGLFFLTTLASSLVGGVGQTPSTSPDTSRRALPGFDRLSQHLPDLAGSAVTTLVRGPDPAHRLSVCHHAATAIQDGGALCDVRTPRRQRCSKKLSFMHR
jgi:hypothetical protein